MNFASDNWPGAHPAIAQNLLAASTGHYAPYGASDLDRKVADQISEMFEREVAAFFVGTGTAANSLSLASASQVGGVIFCHPEAHIIHHEGGAVEFQTGGAKLVPAANRTDVQGKIDPESLRHALARFPVGDVHVGQKMAISISQATEAGTVYTTDEIAEIAGIAHEAGLIMHMDGARFSNAVARLGCTPAEMTWKAGVDILSLGGTKNGCFCAEAVVFFNPDQAKAMPHLRKRGANLFSKSSFIAAQFEAWLTDRLWLDLARHANAMAERLADAVRASSRARLAWETGSNQLFITMSDGIAAALRAEGARFYDWDTPRGFEHEVGDGEQIRRFITSYATTEDEIAALAAHL